MERATARRAQQLADTALRDYHATAHGYLTFLAQVGENFPDPPKVVRSDELALEVYWRAPNLSKQRIVGRRDTLALPTNIAYHQDHLGIVQNNFPSIIRIGDGDEVRDVPHPLSDAGNGDYDFAIRDSLSIRLPGRTVQVYELNVRPKDATQPRLVGALYIDRSTGDVVRMAFTFTRPAYLDKELEDISIVLENALVQGRFWLPLHQEVEIRRTGKWLDFPARGIIRGRWEISGLRDRTATCRSRSSPQGPEITSAPLRELAKHEWHGRILDSLPSDVRAASDDDVRKVQEEARALVQQQALARAQGASLSARKASDFVRANRVEGLALGAGASVRAGGGIVTSLRGRYGFSDHELEGTARRRAPSRRRHGHRAVRHARLSRCGRCRRAIDGGEQLRCPGVRKRRHRSVRCGGRGRDRGARRARRASVARERARGSGRTRSACTRAPRGGASSARFPPSHCTRSGSRFSSRVRR